MAFTGLQQSLQHCAENVQHREGIDIEVEGKSQQPYVLAMQFKITVWAEAMVGGGGGGGGELVSPSWLAVRPSFGEDNVVSSALTAQLMSIGCCEHVIISPTSKRCTQMCAQHSAPFEHFKEELVKCALCDKLSDACAAWPNYCLTGPFCPPVVRTVHMHPAGPMSLSCLTTRLMRRMVLRLAKSQAHLSASAEMQRSRPSAAVGCSHCRLHQPTSRSPPSLL